MGIVPPLPAIYIWLSSSHDLATAAESMTIFSTHGVQMDSLKGKINEWDLLQLIQRKIKLDKQLTRQKETIPATTGITMADQVELYGEIVRRLKIQNKKLLEQVTSLRERLKNKNRDGNKMQARMISIEKLNNSLAQALGSCESCWGEDTGCVHCSGNGTAGWRKVNRRLYNMYVLPMLEKKYGLNRK